MIEILERIMRHTELLHNTPRANVLGYCNTDHLWQPKDRPGMFQNGLSGFGCQALAPGLPHQPPSDLHARREMGAKRWHTQPKEAGKAAVRSEFRRIQSESVLSKMTFDL